MEWYAKFNEMSGCTLRFDDVDEGHFNYLLFNRCIRKTAGMDKSDFLSILKSFKIFSDFLREEGIHTADLFLKISNQEEKMIKRLEDYEYLGNLCDEGKISEELEEKIFDLLLTLDGLFYQYDFSEEDRKMVNELIYDILKQMEDEK